MTRTLKRPPLPTEIAFAQQVSNTMSKETKYIIRARSTAEKHPMHDDPFWVAIYEARWTPGIAKPVSGTDKYDEDIMAFDTEEEARSFTLKWTPNPAYIDPMAFEIVPVTPQYKKKVTGYEKQ
jgi:hypothetical protein